MDELERLGVRQLPVVARGTEWVNGQILKDVARIAGIRLGEVRMLPVEELFRRQTLILEAAQRYLAQMSEEQLRLMLPNRPRSYGQLLWHIFNVADAFLEHEQGIALVHAAYNRVAAPGLDHKAAIAAYGRDVQARLAAYIAGPAQRRDWTANADVYYGQQTVHEYLERTTWHFGQHVRQVMWVMEKLGIAVDQPLPESTWEGLPMPSKVWDD